MNRIWC